MNRLRNHILFAVLLLFSAAWAASPQEALDNFLASPSITPEKTALLVYDLNTGRTLAAYNDGLGLVPASVMKTVTAASFTNKFGYSDRLKTPVYYTGRLKDGTIEGDIVVVGAGDPSLNRDSNVGDADLVSEIVEALKGKGVRRIAGKIKVDDSFIGGTPTHPSWGAEDVKRKYGTGYHAFNYQGNASGNAAVANPADVFVSKLKKALAANEIELSEGEISAAKRSSLLVHQSPMLSNIVRACLFRSDNLYAEGLLRLFGKKQGTDGSTEESARAQMEYLERAGYPMMYVNVVDGSGLSRNNRLTVDFLGEILGDKSEDAMFVTLLPLVGEQGTVRGFMKGTRLEGKMALKTGSMNGIQSYAGYKLDDNLEPTHVVVVIANDLKNREKFRSDLTRFFLDLFE